MPAGRGTRQSWTAFNYGKQVLLGDHSAGLRLGLEPGFNFRLKIQGDGHGFRYGPVYGLL